MPANKPSSSPSGNRPFLVLVAAVLVVGAAIIGYVVLKPKPEPIIVDNSLPLPEAKGYVLGSATAPVEIIEFADFECGHCAQFATTTGHDIRDRIVASGAARYRFMDFPLNGPSTLFAHNAAACANAQGKFWEMHDRIFAGQFDWSEGARGRDMNAPKVMKRYAKELGLDTGAFGTCLDGRQFQRQIDANREEGVRRRVDGTPTLFIGNRMLPGAGVYDQIKALVDSATAEAKKK